MSDYDLERNVTDELGWDPKVDAKAIGVTADDGIVTLRGTVSTFRQKREAAKDAERVAGVKRVENKLEIRIMNKDRRENADLRGAVLQALMLDSVVPSTIDADVDDGFVTLTGQANWRPISSTRSRRRWSATRSSTRRTSPSRARTGRSRFAAP